VSCIQRMKSIRFGHYFERVTPVALLVLRVPKVTTDVSLHATQQVSSRRRPSVDLLARVGESFVDAGLVASVWVTALIESRQ
jgi:hypothetical protein